MTTFPIPTEHEEQCAFIELARYRLPYPEWKLLFAIPNGGLRNKVVAAKLKAEGVMPGVPDLFFSKPCGEYHGLYIEMKRPKGGRLSSVQDEMAELLMKQGYAVACCEGAQEAIETLAAYRALGKYKR